MWRLAGLLAAAIGTFALGISGSLAAGPPPHAAITIASDADFQSCACVTGGAGTAASPYVIGPWLVQAAANGGWALKVDNSKGRVTKYFKIAGITAGYDDLVRTHPVVWLAGVTRQTIVANVVANNDGTGVELDSSANITLTGIDVNKLNGDGVLASSSSNVSIANSKLKAMHEGFHAVNSWNLQIGTTCAGGNPCNAFTYDDGRGIRLDDSHDVTVRSTELNADDTGGILLDGAGTYDVDVGFITVSGNGSICEMGSPTGDVTDTSGGIMLTNGAHDNFIHDLNSHANTGYDIGSGGTGFWVNACTGEIVPLRVTRGMGAGNRFVNVCYTTTNIADLPRLACK